MTIRSLVRSVTLLVAAFVAALTALHSPAANAAVISTSGAVGTYSIPRGDCYNRPAWNQLELRARIPSIYATNYRAGAGNDAQHVRYRVLVWDMRTARYVAQSGFSGTAVAYDNRPASFSGSPTSFRLDRLGRYRLAYEFEFFHPQTGRLSGRQSFELTQYQYYNGYQAGPFGPFDSCLQNG